MIEQMYKVTVATNADNVPDYFTSQYGDWLFKVKEKAIKRSSTFGSVVVETAYFDQMEYAVECEKELTKRLHP